MLTSGEKASDIVREKLLANGGTTVIPLQKGDFCTITSTDNGRAFTSDKLNRHSFEYEFSVFDVVVDLLKNSPQGRAKKGNAHGKGDKVGYGRCTADTVVGTIAIHYFGKKTGESCFDPVFVLAAVLEWAGIAKNGWGYIQLSQLFWPNAAQ